MLTRRRCCDCGGGGGFHICGSCEFPDTMFLTDSYTTVQMDWDNVRQAYQGCYTRELDGVDPCACFNGICDTAPITVLQKYQVVFTSNPETHVCSLTLSGTMGACRFCESPCAGQIVPSNPDDPGDPIFCPDWTDVGSDCDESGYPFGCDSAINSGTIFDMPDGVSDCLPLTMGGFTLDS